MPNKICVICEDEFDPNSPEKRRSGGLITTCPSCSEENVVKYVGLQAADGKMSQATILKFDSEKDKNDYVDFWKHASGMHKGKSCQLSKTTKTTPKIKFTTITNFTPTNHKGKA